ncbi:unnamed protein product [Echinostoma caproni]|uniref:Uncharacterized protein n=1 Tax=Echinostoma caproni TaxID=27848 RepID=A0A183AH58_9TREM|nr:unnamed protein product [Echinostoma caproni]
MSANRARAMQRSSSASSGRVPPIPSVPNESPRQSTSSVIHIPSIRMPDEEDGEETTTGLNLTESGDSPIRLSSDDDQTDKDRYGP